MNDRMLMSIIICDLRLALNATRCNKVINRSVFLRWIDIQPNMSNEQSDRDGPPSTNIIIMLTADEIIKADQTA